MANFGHLLKKYRERLKLGQEDVAARAQTSAATISKIERGLHDVSNKTRRKLAAAFGLSLDEFERELAKASDIETIEVPREVYDGLAAKAARHKLTLDAYLRSVALGGVVIRRREPTAGGGRLVVRKPAPAQ